MTFPDYVVLVVTSFRCKDVKMFCPSMFSLASSENTPPFNFNYLDPNHVFFLSIIGLTALEINAYMLSLAFIASSSRVTEDN